MKFWERYWFGPVAAVRPYLFSKLLLLIVGCDAIVLMTERGSRYGLDGFSVAHFRWLDAFHPTPSEAWYVGILMLVSFLAFTMLLSGPNRPLQILLTVLFSYSWMMDRHDSYMHHYMISLIMAAMIFFPAVRAKDLLGVHGEPRGEPLNGRGRGEGHRNGSILPWIYVIGVVAVLQTYRGIDSLSSSWIVFPLVVAILAIATLLLSRTHPRESPLTCAWGYRLLGATVGVIYIYTSLAKADAEWCGGHTLQKVGTTTIVLQPIEQLAGSIGVSPDLFWASLATLVIPLELTISASYFVAITQDQPERKWTRYWCCLAWILAISLHVNNEMMNLSIQWFGYYMMFLASMFFLPARVLMAAATVFVLPTICLQRLVGQFGPTRKASELKLICVATVVLAVAILLAFGAFADVPGAILLMPILALVVGLIGLIAAFIPAQRKLMPYVCSSVASAGLMFLVVAQSDMRFDYYDIRGRMLQNLARLPNQDRSSTLMLEPRHEETIEAFRHAMKYADWTDRKTADTLCNLGVTLRKNGEIQAARKSFQDAIYVDPGHFLAHYSLANNYRLLEQYDKAIKHYQAAVKIKPDFSDAYINLGVSWEAVDRLDNAIACYERALEIEPNTADILQRLAAAKDKVSRASADPPPLSN